MGARRVLPEKLDHGQPPTSLALLPDAAGSARGRRRLALPLLPRDPFRLPRERRLPNHQRVRT